MGSKLEGPSICKNGFHFDFLVIQRLDVSQGPLDCHGLGCLLCVYSKNVLV